jgi:hypothetical protein
MRFEELLVYVKANMRNAPFESWTGDAEEPHALQVGHEDLHDIVTNFLNEKFLISY